MDKATQVNVPFEWTPFVITDIDTTTKERTGYIGRAVALRQNNLEFVILARTAEDIDLITQNFMGFSIDTERVYKATMIASEGVTVDMERKPVPPVVPEVEADPTGGTPVEHEHTIPTTPVEKVVTPDDDEL